MNRIKLGILVIALFLIGCQQQDNLHFDEQVTDIKVVTYDTEENVATITDKQFINELMEKLDQAKVSPTADKDFPMPDYKLLFRNNQDVIFEIGYYKEIQNFGVESRYWKFDDMYNVKQKLPLGVGL